MVKAASATAAAASTPLSAEEVAFIMTVLKEVEVIQVNWKSVASKVGITRHDNATTKFNNVLKKVGCKLIKGQIVTIDEAAVANPKKTANNNSVMCGTPPTGKKRTTSPSSDKNGDGLGAKKAKIADSE